ncbi:MAG: zinc ribbon domain-containing protein [Chloroflexi bacterium]|nr:zinc ribbon domain-containing protein [Chloroflexota bacterium]
MGLDEVIRGRLGGTQVLAEVRGTNSRLVALPEGVMVFPDDGRRQRALRWDEIEDVTLDTGQLRPPFAVVRLRAGPPPPHGAMQLTASDIAVQIIPFGPGRRTAEASLEKVRALLAERNASRGTPVEASGPGAATGPAALETASPPGFCPQCGAPRDTQARFCASCGAPLSGAAIAPGAAPRALPAAASPVHVSVEPYHLFRYLDERAFTFNERGKRDLGRFIDGRDAGSRPPRDVGRADRQGFARNRRSGRVEVRAQSAMAKPERHMRGMHASILALALLAAGCGGATTPTVQAPTTAPTSTAAPTVPSSQPSASRTASAIPSASVTPATVTGFGATSTAWDAAHATDTNFPGQMYEPDPAIGGADRYFAFMRDGGRVVGYTMHIPPQDLALAESQALTEVPADTRVLWMAKRNVCEQMELQSSTLGTLLSRLGDKAGDVFVELDTVDFNSGAPPSFDAHQIDNVVMAIGSYSSAAKAPAC